MRKHAADYWNMSSYKKIQAAALRNAKLNLAFDVVLTAIGLGFAYYVSEYHEANKLTAFLLVAALAFAGRGIWHTIKDARSLMRLRADLAAARYDLSS